MFNVLNLISFFLLLSSTKVLSSISYLKPEISGNLIAEFRRTNNNDLAKDPPLLQDWENENFTLAYGNLHAVWKKDDLKFETNLFGRYANSQLYSPDPLKNPLGGEIKRDPYLATTIFTFPSTLVTRNFFQMILQKQKDDYFYEILPNKMFFELKTQSGSLSLGRIYINYGLGEIFNPINPFNQPTALTSSSQIAQGNDGASYSRYFSDNHRLDFFILGHRERTHAQDILLTMWLHGEYQPQYGLQFHYALGFDQERYKLGSEMNFSFKDALIFTQLFYQGERVDTRQSHDLFDFLIGYDKQITTKSHLRFEAGYQKQNKSLNFSTFERFLPTEYFIAMSHLYDIHPLINLKTIIIGDLQSQFTYLNSKITYNFKDNMEAEIFMSLPIASGSDTHNLAQKIVTTDLGLTFRLYF